MKSCPTCNRTFEDTLTYCLIDGSILSAPFDPHATLVIPQARQTEPPPTDVLPAQEVKEEIPPTIASPQPEQKPEELASTIAAPAPAFESSKVEATPTQSALKAKRTVTTESANQSSLKYLVGLVGLLALLTVYIKSPPYLLLALIVSSVAFLVYKKPTRTLNSLGWIFVLVVSLFIVIFTYLIFQNSKRRRQPSPSEVDVNITTPSK